MFNGYETRELVEQHIEALLRDLAEQEQLGNKKGAEACREQLRLFGHVAKAPAKRAEKRPAAAAKAEKR